MTRLRHMIEGWSPRKVRNMTVICLSAVGFVEVRPLSSPQQWFTIAYLILGLGYAGSAVASITALKGRLLDRRILQLSNHFVRRRTGCVVTLGNGPQLVRVRALAGAVV